MSQPAAAAEALPSTTYDEVPYESYPFQQSHPDRLATMAKLFGMESAPVSKCRVLELGCAGGGNLIPLAYNYPESQFVGLDLSKVHLETGNKTVEALGLKNIELKHASIMDVNSDYGTFDYIIVHGVYSWVPEEVKEKILDICRDNLSENGIAYISYNVFPGWHFRGMIREMMLYHVEQFEDAANKTAQARALIDFLSQSVPPESSAYGMMLKNELDFLKASKDYYLLHEYLEDINTPMYFHEFVERAEKRGFQFLSEAEFYIMLTNQFSKEVAETLARISNEIVRTEQYMDFVRNRLFRQTLICRRSQTLNRNLNPASIMPFYVSSPVKDFKPDLTSASAETFSMNNGMTVTASSPFVKAAFQHLSEIWPQSVAFPDLVKAAYSKLGLENQEANQLETQSLATDMLNMYCNNLVYLRTTPPPFVTEISEKPKVSELVRHQAETDLCLTNQLHEYIRTDAFGQQLIKLCDGTKTHDELLQEMIKRFQDGTLKVHKGGMTLSEEADIREAIQPLLNDMLKTMAKTAVLVG